MTTSPFRTGSQAHAAGGPFSKPAASTGRPATDRQMAFLKSLIQDRDASSTGVDFDLLLETTPGLTTAQVSRMIDLLKGCPRKAAPEAKESATPAVEDGSYALEFDGQLRFFHVRSPKSGRWEGYTFVEEKAGPEEYPVRDRARRARILEAIAADPEALARYGQELGICARCHRELTDEASRAAGLGPTCRSKV